MGDYYTEWDRWFAEEHDGSPVEFTVCEVDTGERDCDHESLCWSKGPGAAPGDPHHRTWPDEIHKVIHRFTASSWIEANQKMNAALGAGPYMPHPLWSEEESKWLR